MNVRAQMERIYRELPPGEIPWNLERPPRVLVDLVESGRLSGRRIVDLGCGAGNSAVWLAEQGFEVTGLDLSPAAIALAAALARRRGVSCEFVVADMLDDMPALERGFDVAYDWEVLHHVVPADRPRYVEHVHRLLRPGGAYLSVCFAEGDPGLPGEGKVRHTALGTVLYLSSAEEVRGLMEPWFDVIDVTTIEVEGRRGPHLAVRAWLASRADPPGAAARRGQATAPSSG